VIIVGGRRIHKCAVPETVLLEAGLVLLSHSESLQSPFILQLQTGLAGSVLHQAEHLHVQLGVPDDAAIPAHVFIGNVSPADIALVLDLNELSVDDSA